MTRSMKPRVAPAAATGNTRAALEALRDRLAYALDATDSARDVASLSRQLADVIAQLDELDDRDADQVDPLAELLMGVVPDDQH